MNLKLCKRLDHPDLNVLMDEIERVQQQNRQLRAGVFRDKPISQQPMSRERYLAIIRLAYADSARVRAAGEQLIKELDQVERENAQLANSRFSLS